MMNQFYTLFTAPYLHELGVQGGLGPLGTWSPEVVMTLAQWCEIGCMAATPLLLSRLGLKRLMILGWPGWCCGTRCCTRANVPGVVAVGLPMHGWSYAFYGMIGVALRGPRSAAAPAGRRAVRWSRSSAAARRCCWATSSRAAWSSCTAPPASPTGPRCGSSRSSATSSRSWCSWLLFKEPPADRGQRTEARGTERQMNDADCHVSASLAVCFLPSVLWPLSLVSHGQVLQVQVGRGPRSRERAARHRPAVHRRPCAAVPADHDRRSRTVGNRWCIHPMEGCDGELDGTPGELTFRRYVRFGAGGAKIIWGEACAVNDARPRQPAADRR